MAEKTNTLRLAVLIAAAMNGFALIVVNYWIYTARWTFIETQSQFYFEPPTISRAISIDMIGDPFAIWITISSICLLIGVFLLLRYYWAVRHHLVSPTRSVRLAMVLVPVIFIVQAFASWGMHTLSVYRFPDYHAMHMVGSFTFFGCQVLVIVLYTFTNNAFLNDRPNMERLENAGLLNAKWVKFRRNLGLFSVALTLVYLVLFVAKGQVSYEDFPWVQLAYVTTEPLVISMFLFVLAFSHVDKFSRQPVDVS